jgi:hypothetical protein
MELSEDFDRFSVHGMKRKFAACPIISGGTPFLKPSALEYL